MSKGYSLSDLQRMKEEMEIGARLHRVAREHHMREVLGDEVYEFMTRESLPELNAELDRWRAERRQAFNRTLEQIKAAGELMDRLLDPEEES